MKSFRSSVSNAAGAGIYTPNETNTPPDYVKPLTQMQKMMISFIVFGVFVGSMIYSSLGSFFPQSAFTKNLDSVGVGIIISVLPLATTTLGGVAGYVINRIGPRFVFVSSMFIASGASIPFAFIMYADTGFDFYFSCLACRIVQGIGFLGIELSSLSICVGEFSDRVSLLVGLVEMSIGAGISVGPAIGGIIFDMLGFEAPYLIIGGIGFVTFIFAYFFVKPSFNYNEGDGRNLNKEGEITIPKFFKIPSVYIPMITVLLGSMNMAFFEVSISPYLTETFGLSISIAGLIIFGYAGLYAILCPLIGAFTDKKGYHSVILAAGCFIVGPGFLFIGPGRVFCIQPQLWITVLSFMFIGIGSSCMYVPAIELSLQICRNIGYNETTKLQSIVTTIILFSANTGNLLGPFLGGIMVEEIGFPQAGVVLAAITLVVGVLSVLYIIFNQLLTKNRREAFIKEEREYLIKTRTDC